MGAVLVLLPGPSLLGADRTFQIDPLAGAVGTGAGLQLGDLVALPAGQTGLVHAVGLGDHHHAGGEAGPALVAAASRHEPAVSLRCGTAGHPPCRPGCRLPVWESDPGTPTVRGPAAGLPATCPAPCPCRAVRRSPSPAAPGGDTSAGSPRRRASCPTGSVRSPRSGSTVRCRPHRTTAPYRADGHSGTGVRHRDHRG